MDRPLVALVLAGGTGTRLFPASRPHRPKQFLSLDGDRSLLERTVSRVAFADETVVVTRPDLEGGVRERVDAPVLVEPAPRDTGPALVYATHRIRERVGDCVVLALPSDHVVRGDFETTARRAARVATADESLVTVGVDPTRPETGYGYIEPGEVRGDAFEVAAFHEKPDAQTARAYVEAGHLWNAGIFAWTPEALLDAATTTPLAPLVDALDAGDAEAGFDAVDPTSIDYAVLERAENLRVVPADFDWDDVGAWDALSRLLPADADGLVALAPDDAAVTALDSTDSVVASDGPNVSLVGVSELAVVAWDDHVLVVPLAQAQRVRELARLVDGDG